MIGYFKIIANHIALLDKCLNIVGRAFAKYDDIYVRIVNIIAT